MSVYFIKCNEYVKIGYSSNPYARINSIKTSNPHEVEVLLVIPGNVELEKELHYILRDSNYKNEWFLFDDKIRGIVEMFSGLFSEYSTAATTHVGNFPPKALDESNSDESDPEYSDSVGRKANIIRREIALDPKKSDAEIAEIVGCSRMYSWMVRNGK